MSDLPPEPPGSEEEPETFTDPRFGPLVDRLPKVVRFSARREIKDLANVLGLDETVVALAQGRYSKRQGLVLATDRRVVFLEHGMVRRIQEDFPYDRISSVGAKKSLVSGALTIHASGNDAEIDNIVPKDSATEIAEVVRARLGSPKTSTTTSPEPSAPTAAEKVRELAQLRDEGLLSEDEFERKRRELLGL